MKNATDQGPEGKDEEGDLHEHPEREEGGKATQTGSGYRIIPRRQEDRIREEDEEEGPTVTQVELGVVPQMMWICPDCKTVHSTQASEIIMPVGNYQQIEWQCDCGHEGRIARVRMKVSNREQRRREERMKKKLRRQLQ